MGYLFSDDDTMDQSEDELKYEPFEDVEWTDPDDLDAIDLAAIDLDVLDDEIEEVIEDANTDDGNTESGGQKPALAKPAAGQLKSLLAPKPELPPSPPARTGPEPVPEPPAPKPTPESAAPDSVPETATPVPAEPITPPEKSPPPVIPPDVFCAVLALPPDVGAGILALRTTGEINTMPPPGVILTPHFRTLNIDAVKTVLADWTRIHLPIQLEITDLKAEVIGAQQYIAAWTLEPQEELQEAIHVLKRTLAEFILPLSGTANTIGTHVMIGDHIPPERYTHVISQMQRNFETSVWQSTDLQLVRRVPDTDQAASASHSGITWELDQRFD